MDENAFEEALDRWGSNLSTWPDAERQAADELLTQSLAARSLLESGRRMDSALFALMEHTVSPALEQRILAQLPLDAASGDSVKIRNSCADADVDRGQWLWTWLTASVWRPAALASVPLIVGFTLGLGLPDLTEQELADQVAMLALSNIYQEIDDAQQ